MKKTIFTLFVLLLISTTIICASNHELAMNKKAVNQEDEQLEGKFLDPVFQFGRVNFKDGAISDQDFNYLLSLSQICYLNEEGKPLVLSDLSDIESVRYGKRTFLPIDKSKVAEIVKTFSDESVLLLQRQTKVSRVSDSSGPYGTSTETATISRLNTMHEWNINQQLEAESMYKRIIKENFILLKNGKRHKITNLRSLRKVFRSRWNDIRAYASENKTDFENYQDLINLIEFANQQDTPMK